MTDKVAIFVVNYNMPERADALAEAIRDRVKWPHDLYVIDNGSDIAEPSKYTNVWIPDNVQTTGGWLCGLAAADSFGPYMAYWFLITSAELVGAGDPLARMMEMLHDDVVGVHPAMTTDSTTSWEHLKTRGHEHRRTWFIDNIASLWRADWFDENGRFDPELEYAWGIDLETCLQARRQGKMLYVCEPATVRKVTNIGYTMDRMNMTANEREEKAGANMREVLSKRYGPYWWQIMTGAHVEQAWL